MITLYGIPNCDTVKKARSWLTAHGLEHDFYDFKKHGVPADAVDLWLASAGWQTLLNRKGSTWRQLDAQTQASVSDNTSAKAVMLAHASVIKRPVIVWPSGAMTVGFTPDVWPA